MYSFADGRGSFLTPPIYATSNLARKIQLGAAAMWLGFAITSSPASTTFTDNFNTSLNYLTNGVRSTIWDGIYLGAGEIADPSGLGSATVSVANANISSNSALTISSYDTDWENTSDDGMLLFKVITGNFDMSVHVLGPIDTSAYNYPGLMVRAFGTNGAPSPNGSENYFIWGRFDEFGIANMLKNNVNGGKTDTGLGAYPNANYWLRVMRSGNTFTLYEKATQGAAWINVGTVTRADFSGLPLQVGIEHADYTGATRTANYGTFSLTVSNMGPFATAPSPATNLTAVANASGGLDVSWTPGAGSSGSLVALWTGTNNAVKETPANGFTYTGNANYGLGSSLPGATWYVVYAGSGSSVSVGNLSPDTSYNVAVFSYAGSGSAIAYNHTPPTASVAVPENPVSAQAHVQAQDVVVTAGANPGKWYWLQYSDSLTPPSWQNVVPGPVLATSRVITLVHSGGATAPMRYYRVLQTDPLFTLKQSGGAITSLQRTDDNFPTEYMAGRLGDAVIRYRPAAAATWQTAQTVSLSGVASTTNYASADGTQYIADYKITNGLAGPLIFETVFTFQQDALLWTLNITNLTGGAVEIGDLALPLPMNDSYSGVSSCAIKHSYIEGYGSFIFWIRPDSVGPYLLMTPADNTKLEFWDGATESYEAYIHSYVAGTNAAAQYPSVTTQGARWRQPNTSLTLAGGGSQSYGFKFQWANDYDGIRQALVDEGKLDIHVVPGMTVPTNLFAEIALRTTQTVASVTAEFPTATQITFLGTTNVGANGTYQLYQVQFSQLGENELTIQYGNARTTYLEFFVTEPIETLIKKRAVYLVNHQTNSLARWYNGLYCDLNMNDGVLITPDNHDTLDSSFQVYEIASDDAGESRPAYIAAKEAMFPVQSEVTSLDNYIKYFVWNTLAPTGGLQRTTSESYSDGVYGVPDWNNLRSSGTLSLGRGYDYPHILVMYYGMYQVAKFHPEVTTYLVATQYLARAYGTAMALWTYGGGQATQVGLMNELVIPDIITALQAEGMTNQAASLTANWETKVRYYLDGNADLFASEYAFDATGFESQEAYAKYAMLHAGSDPLMGSTNLPAFLQEATNFMTAQITANVFDRGWLETAYYYYGSDFRGDMGDDFVLTYMAQMGGWAVLDYALNFAPNPADYLRLGYASILSAWATMNSGPPPNYGFWYPGAAYDGGCGGGFEPSPYNTTWLNGQPMHRGPWYYSAEENLGFCGAIRAAATILADDPIFGRFCYGGTWQQTTTIQVMPLDGVRRRFHALLNEGACHLVIDTDRFDATHPIMLQPDLSSLGFTLETDNPLSHTAALHLTFSTAGTCTVNGPSGTVATLTLQAGVEAVLNLPIPAGTSTIQFTVSR